MHVNRENKLDKDPVTLQDVVKLTNKIATADKIHNRALKSILDKASSEQDEFCKDLWKSATGIFDASDLVYLIFFLQNEQVYIGKTSQTLSKRIECHTHNTNMQTGRNFKIGNKAIAIPMRHETNPTTLLSLEKELTKSMGSTLNINNNSKIVSKMSESEIKSILAHIKPLNQQAAIKYTSSLQPYQCIRIREWLEKTKSDRSTLDLFIKACQKHKVVKPSGAIEIPRLSSSNGSVKSIIMGVKGFPYGNDGLVHLKLKMSYLDTLGRQLFNCFDVDPYEEVDCKQCRHIMQDFAVQTWNGHVATSLHEYLKAILRENGGDIEQSHDNCEPLEQAAGYKELLNLVECGTKLRCTPPRAKCVEILQTQLNAFKAQNEDNVPRHFGNVTLAANASEEDVKAHKKKFTEFFEKWVENVVDALMEDMDEKVTYPSSVAAKTIREIQKDFIICPTDKSPQTPSIICRHYYLSVMKGQMGHFKEIEKSTYEDTLTNYRKLEELMLSKRLLIKYKHQDSGETIVSDDDDDENYSGKLLEETRDLPYLYLTPKLHKFESTTNTTQMVRKEAWRIMVGSAADQYKNTNNYTSRVAIAAAKIYGALLHGLEKVHEAKIAKPGKIHRFFCITRTDNMRVKLLENAEYIGEVACLDCTDLSSCYTNMSQATVIEAVAWAYNMVKDFFASVQTRRLPRQRYRGTAR